MIEIILASNNSHKIEEFQRYFQTFGIQFVSLREKAIDVDPEETGKTFQENAFLKVQAVAEFTDQWIVSDDSGLCIDALDGFPGIFSARFMQEHSYKEKCVELHRRLEQVKEKTAAFHCVLCLFKKGKTPRYFEGIAKGLLVPYCGDDGFGYDPAFYSLEGKKRFSEMNQAEKAQVSHRGKAMEALAHYIKEGNLKK